MAEHYTDGTDRTDSTDNTRNANRGANDRAVGSNNGIVNITQTGYGTRRPEATRSTADRHAAAPVRRVGLKCWLPGRVSRLTFGEALDRYDQLSGLLRAYEYSDAPADVDHQHHARAVEQCREIVRHAERHISPRPKDITRLWRYLTRLHITLAQQILPTQLLVDQVSTVTEDAERLRTAGSPDIRDLLARLERVTNEADPDRQAIVRALRPLLERYLSIRTQRVHLQLQQMVSYLVAMTFLIPISMVIIANVGLFQEPAAGTATALGVFDLGTYSLQNNVVFFVFFAGLAGGFFSVVMNVRRRVPTPGDDAYFGLYMLTKPLIGAFGAMIMFLIGNLVPLTDTGTPLTALTQQGATLFGFAFLAGFSERLILPAADMSKSQQDEG